MGSHRRRTNLSSITTPFLDSSNLQQLEIEIIAKTSGYHTPELSSARFSSSDYISTVSIPNQRKLTEVELFSHKAS